MGNLILHIKGRERSDRLMLVGYAMCAAPSMMQNPIRVPLSTVRPTNSMASASGAGACEQKGSLAAMAAINHRRGQSSRY